MLKSLLLGVLCVVVGLVVFGVYNLFQRAALSQEMSPELGALQQSQSACPDSPNCVSSFSQDERHRIASIEGDLEDFRALSAYIAETSNAEVRVLSNNYLWAIYTSKLFGFADDLEIYHDGSQIQVRSASRVGYEDLGANRSRVETLRTFLENR